MTHLLLEGPSGIGKTTLILNKLGPLRQKAGGFVTRRMVDDTGASRGFCLTRANSAAGAFIPFNKNHPGIFIDHTSGTHSEAIFLEKGIGLLQNIEGYPYLITDEIGGVELLEPDFFLLLTELFSKNIPCIGVLKSRENSRHLVSAIGSDVYSQRYAEFRKILRANSKVDIVFMKQRDEPKVVRKIDEFIQNIGVTS